MALVMKDVGNEIDVIAGGGVPTTSAFFTAGGSTTYTGYTIDRLALGRRYLSAKAAVLVSGVFTGSSGTPTHTVLATVRMFDSPTSTAWTAYGSSQDASYAWTATSSGQMRASLNTRWDLSRARRYVRWQYDGLAVTGSVSSSGLENAIMHGLAVVLGGAEQVPPLANDSGAIST